MFGPTSRSPPHQGRGGRIARAGGAPGARTHSPNEYAPVEGMPLYEKSVARFVQEFAAIRA